jgi:hypothetical protein
LFFWSLGLLFLFFGILLTYNILEGKNSDKKIFNGFYGEAAWEYVVLSFIYVMGVSMFVVAKYEKIKLDRFVK